MYSSWRLLLLLFFGSVELNCELYFNEFPTSFIHMNGIFLDFVRAHDLFKRRKKPKTVNVSVYWQVKLIPYQVCATAKESWKTNINPITDGNNPFRLQINRRFELSEFCSVLLLLFLAKTRYSRTHWPPFENNTVFCYYLLAINYLIKAIHTGNVPNYDALILSK